MLPFYRWGYWALESWSHLPKVIRFRSGRGKMEIQGCWIPKSCSFCPAMLAPQGLSQLRQPEKKYNWIRWDSRRRAGRSGWAERALPDSTVPSSYNVKRSRVMLLKEQPSCLRNKKDSGRLSSRPLSDFTQLRGPFFFPLWTSVSPPDNQYHCLHGWVICPQFTSLTSYPLTYSLTVPVCFLRPKHPNSPWPQDLCTSCFLYTLIFPLLSLSCRPQLECHLLSEPSLTALLNVISYPVLCPINLFYFHST